MPVITHISGERAHPETQKLTVIVPFEGGQIHAEIPAPGLLVAQDDLPDRTRDLILRASQALREAILALKQLA